MKYPIVLLSLVLFFASAAQAEPSKAECKAFAKSLTDLANQLGLSAETTGRKLLTRVEAWIEGQDMKTIADVAGQIEQAIAGIQACEAARHSSKIQEVKALSGTMETAVLPWLKRSSVVDACQDLVNQAARKKATDPDGAIVDLENSVRDCKEDVWLREAHRTLVSLYYARGDVAKRDYEMARDQTRQGLALSTGLGEEDRQALAAVLARPTIEAGRMLMEQKEFEQAKLLWESYIETFGTADFDVLFRVEEVAQGAWMLRELTDARYQLSLACIGLGDLSCVGDPAESYKHDPQLIRELTSRAFERAAGATDAERVAVYRLAFELLAAWNEIDPGSYQVKKLLNDSLVSRERSERLELLHSVDQCWIRMHVAEELRERGEEYLEEVEIAAACGGADAGAQEMLDEIYVQAAFDMVDRLDIHASTVSEKRALLTDVEKRLLPKIDDPAKADELRSKIAGQRERIRKRIAQNEQLNAGRYSGCTELLATIQWNVARENEFDSEVAEFKRDCCRFLSANTNGWVAWMRAKPEDMRLADEEIENKTKLMKRYCAR